MDRNQGARRGRAIAGMVLGILSVVLLPVPVLDALLALVAVVLSATALGGSGGSGASAGRGMAIAGLVLGIVGLVCGLPYTLGASYLCVAAPVVSVM